MKGSVKLPVFIDDARKYVNTTQLRAKYLGASYEAEYCQWQTLHGLGSLMETASLIITPNAYLEGKLIASYPPDPIGDFDVTRATTATRVNSAGLVELVPYNLVPYSQEFSNSSFWSYYISSVTANTTTAPDGTMTADTLLITSGINGSTYQTFSSYSGGVYNLSAYYKKTNEDLVYMDCSSSGGYFGASFNLTTQAISTFGGGFSPLIESVGGGWYRCSVNGYIEGNGGFGFGIYAGAGQSAYIWGAQLNEGGLKDYQKTETRLNIPRLDYSNGTCPSLLVEPQRTNLSLYSEDLTNAYWNKFNSSISANATTAPSGIATADKVIENTSNSFHYVESTNVLTLGNTYAISCFIKKAEREYAYIGIYTFESKQIRVNLNDGTITSTTGTWLSTSVEDYGNGWYRVIGTFSAYPISYFFAGPALDGSTPTYTGDGTSGVYIWGVQLE